MGNLYVTAPPPHNGASKKYLVCGCWKKNGVNLIRIAVDYEKYGTLTTRPDLRENMGYYAPIFILEYEEL